MGLLLDRSGDAAFGNHQTLRRAKLKQASMTIRRMQRGITVSLRFTPTLRLKLPKESSAYSLLLLPCSRAPTDVFDQREREREREQVVAVALLTDKGIIWRICGGTGRILSFMP